jgi:hypothetical protein
MGLTTSRRIFTVCLTKMLSLQPKKLGIVLNDWESKWMRMEPWLFQWEEELDTKAGNLGAVLN